MPNTLTKRGTLLKLPNGRPDLKQLTQRREIVQLCADELLIRLRNPVLRAEIEARDLVNTMKVLDDDLRINKQEHTVRDPLRIIVQHESGL
jgi:hypothetical protein